MRDGEYRKEVKAAEYGEEARPSGGTGKKAAACDNEKQS